ncbi:MAG: hypothetical protein EZS28_027789, partial [Streblomastix strix]
RVTLEDDNKLNDHVYGSRVVNDFYNKPDSLKAIYDYIGNEKNISLMIDSLKLECTEGATTRAGL